MLATMLLAVVASVSEVPSPRPAGWVTDMAGMLTPDAVQAMNQHIDRMHQELGVEIVVVTVDDVRGTPKAFATALFNHWGIGDSRSHNGLLVLMVKGQRRLEMETGYGLEGRLPASWLSTMQREAMVPSFKRADFGEGIVLGLEAVEERLREGAGASREGVATSTPRPAFPRRSANRPRPAPVSSEPAMELLGTIGVTFAGGGSLVGLGAILRRRRQRLCPSCRVDMRLLDEAEDDAHLADGQVKEEVIGSINYRVYVCRQCSFSRVLSRRRWFSGYTRCGHCQFRTMRSSSQTVVAATYSNGGQIRVTEHCEHCGKRRSYVRTTPRLTESTSTSGSSSSSSSSSSGFSGGRSGGGGAGSSW